MFIIFIGSLYMSQHGPCDWLTVFAEHVNGFSIADRIYMTDLSALDNVRQIGMI